MNDLPPDLKRSLDDVGRALSALSCSVALPTVGGEGAHAECLTDAVMEAAHGLNNIADAIRELAAAVREARQ